MGQLTALLSALGYRDAAAFTLGDAAAFRSVVVWLENVKVGACAGWCRVVHTWCPTGERTCTPEAGRAQ
jgi:hypothetical protein